MQIILDTRGLQVSVRNGCFLFTTDSESRIVHPDRIDSILVCSPCRVSSPALILAVTFQIPFVICDSCGRPVVRTWSPKLINTSKLRRLQYQFSYKRDSIEWVENLIRYKIEGQKSNLLFVVKYNTSLKNEVSKALNAVDNILSRLNMANDVSLIEYKKKILFAEAFAASFYWKLLGLALPLRFQFSNRVKKNPQDVFNNCINYLYGMLQNQIETAVLSFGLDPALGIMHRDGYKMPSLVFDLMEPFRPIIDRFLFSIFTDGLMGLDILEEKRSKIVISKSGRKNLIILFNKKLDTRCYFRGTGASLRNHILTETKLLVSKIKEQDK
jgi:CRISPR-associated protein Cas1